MQEPENEEQYIICLHSICNMFYKEKTLSERFLNEFISEILTPSDEAFALLCIKIYFPLTIDLEFDSGFDDDFNYVSKRGWKPEAIELYNILYRRVINNRHDYSNQFDKKFLSYTASLVALNPDKK